MKKTLFTVVLVWVFALVLTGCGKEDAKVVCEYTDKADGITMTMKTVWKFDDDNYIAYQSQETTTKFDDEDLYKSYVESAKSADHEEAEGVKYSFKQNDKDKSYTVTNEYTEKFVKNALKEASTEDKKEMTAASIIKSYETVGMKCKYVGVSKKDLGVK